MRFFTFITAFQFADNKQDTEDHPNSMSMRKIKSTIDTSQMVSVTSPTPTRMNTSQLASTVDTLTVVLLFDGRVVSK